MQISGTVVNVESFGHCTIEGATVDNGTGDYLVKLRSLKDSQRYMIVNVDKGLLTKGLDKDGIRWIKSEFNVLQAQLLVQLINHRLSGDEILKGMKSTGTQLTGVKITRNYLGGYDVFDITNGCTRCSIVDLLDWLR